LYLNVLTFGFTECYLRSTPSIADNPKKGEGLRMARSGHPGRPGALFVLAVVTAVIVAACGSTAGTAGTVAPTIAPTTAASLAPSSETSAAPSGSPSAVATFAPPNLTGKTVRMVIGAAPQLTDTQLYVIAKTLRSWGATVNITNVTGAPEADRLILSGGADIGNDPMNSVVNSGLMTFGPAQPRVEYFMAGGKNVATIQALPGHVFGVSNTKGLEALMLAAEEAHYSIDPHSVTLQISGGASVRATELVAGKIDATLVHFDGWLALQGQGFNLLATVADDIPQLADGFLDASPAWLQANPDLAQAIDEAWIVAATEFQNDENTWVADEQAYAKGADATPFVQNAWTVLHAANVWPAASSAFSTDTITYNLQLAATTTGALNASAPPLSAMSTTQYWDQAVKALLP
jgi:hypothetical protein